VGVGGGAAADAGAHRRRLLRAVDGAVAHVRSLVDATQEEVNGTWAGLGYYWRARFLLEGAKQIVEKREFPHTASALREVRGIGDYEVRGIGDYTAGAFASIAFNEVVPVVDRNVVRVISRL